MFHRTLNMIPTHFSTRATSLCLSLSLSLELKLKHILTLSLNSYTYFSVRVLYFAGPPFCPIDKGPSQSWHAKSRRPLRPCPPWRVLASNFGKYTHVKRTKEIIKEYRCLILNLHSHSWPNSLDGVLLAIRPFYLFSTKVSLLQVK